MALAPVGRKFRGRIFPPSGFGQNLLNLETAAGRKTAVYNIGVHGEIQKVVIT